jgi:hemerythrin superfamily protein
LATAGHEADRKARETPVNDKHRQDVTQVLIHDHHEVEEMFAQLEKGDIGDARNVQAVVERVTVELVRHSAAEERHLYPAVRRHVAGGDALADSELREHAEAEKLMKALEHLEPSDDAFDETLARLMAEVRAHIGEEENVLFPQLTAACTREQLLELGDKVTAAKKTAPTHPHPAAPDTPPANAITAPMLGLLDRARDAFTNRDAGQ